jgi:tetratricopeptide (TPR) repeat protein
VGEGERDVAFELGGLLCDARQWAAALPLFEASLSQHGADRATLFNLALCRARLGRPIEALPLVAQLIGADPSFADAQALRREITAALAAAAAD